MSTKFDDIINTKYTQISEVANVQPGAATPNTATATNVANQPQAAQQGQQTPEQILNAALSQVPYNQPETAIKVLNTSIQNLKNNQHFTNFFSNIGFSNGQFVYNTNKQPQQGQQQPQQGQQQGQQQPQQGQQAQQPSVAAGATKPLGKI